MSSQARDNDFDRAQLLLLSKFRTARAPTEFQNSGSWSQAIGGSPAGLIAAFLKRGLVERPSLPELVSALSTLPALKDMLRERGLPTSGRKADLIGRLIANDKVAAEVLVRGADLLICSEKGRAEAEAYLESAQREREAAEQAVNRALQVADFKAASEIVAQFEARQVFPRGLGVDWSQYDIARDALTLESIFRDQPKLLQAARADCLPELRLAAAAMHLWGTNRLPSTTREDLNTGLPYDAATAARMLLFHALHLQSMASYRETGVRSVRFLTANDSLVCPACKELATQVRALSEVPELPYPSCTSEFGCRCITAVEQFAFE